MGLEDIGTFVQVAERGSLSAAARELGVPKSTVSRRIARLERELGQQLIRRSSRAFRLTEVGQTLYKQSAPAIRDLAEATRAVSDVGHEPRGDLRITAPIDLGTAPRFVEFLIAFHDAFPKVRISIDITDRYVDLAAEGYDLAFRVHSHALEDRASLKMRRIGPFTVGLYASPRYLDRAGRPSHPSELAQHATVGVLIIGADERWPLAHAGGKPEVFPIAPALLTSNVSFLPAALEAGAGIGLIANYIAQAAVARGALEHVLPEWELPPAALSLVWPASRHDSPRLRAFLDFTAENMKPPGCP
jgi:DNA-binding transcriptional LysR family regulator